MPSFFGWERPLVWKWNSATRPKLWIDDSHPEPVIIQWKVNSDEESCTMTSSDGDVSHCIVWYRVVLYLYDIVSMQHACILIHMLRYIYRLHTGTATCRHVKFVTRSRPLSPHWAGGPQALAMIDRSQEWVNAFARWQTSVQNKNALRNFSVEGNERWWKPNKDSNQISFWSFSCTHTWKFKFRFDIHIISYEPRKKPSYFPLYWLVNRDPYTGLL